MAAGELVNHGGRYAARGPSNWSKAFRVPDCCGGGGSEGFLLVGAIELFSLSWDGAREHAKTLDITRPACPSSKYYLFYSITKPNSVL